MAIRTAAAAALDADVVQLLADLKTYIALQQSTSSNDAPAKLFWQWLIAQLENVDPTMAIAIRTSNMFDHAVEGRTLSEIDGFA